MDWLIPTAYAQAAGGAQPNAFTSMLPLVLIYTIEAIIGFILSAQREKQRTVA